MDYIVVHKGESKLLDYVITSIHQQCRVYPILIGDEQALGSVSTYVDYYSYDELIDTSELAPAIIDRFKNDGPQADSFELMCFLRFAAVFEVARKLGLPEVVHVDSDLVFLNNFDHMFRFGMRSCDMVLLDESSTYLSAWRRDSLHEFLQWIPEYLRDSDNFEGRVCDMTALKWFHKEKAKRVFFMKPSLPGYSFNTNDTNSFLFYLMQGSGNWDREYHRHNKVELKGLAKGRGGVLLYRRKVLDFVHFQGLTKKYMPDVKKILGVK